jgi:hypothetical protein
MARLQTPGSSAVRDLRQGSLKAILMVATGCLVLAAGLLARSLRSSSHSDMHVLSAAAASSSTTSRSVSSVAGGTATLSASAVFTASTGAPEWMLACLGQSGIAAKVADLPSDVQLKQQATQILSTDPSFAGHPVEFIPLVLTDTSSGSLARTSPGGPDIISAVPSTFLHTPMVVAGLTGFDDPRPSAANAPAAIDPSFASAQDIHTWIVLTDPASGTVAMQIGCS